MKLSFKIFLIILTILFAVNLTQAGPRKKLGTSAAPELLIPVGSIGTSLAGSNTSFQTGIDAMYWNPAGLSQLNSPNVEAMFSHMNYFADMKVEYLGVAAKLGGLGVLGFGVKAYNIGDIEQTTEIQPEGTGATFSPSYIVGNLTFARQMTDRIRFGANVKVINESVADVSSTGVGFDFGIQYKGGESGFNFGIAIKNLGPSMTFNGSGLDRTILLPNGQQTIQRVVLQSFDLPTALDLGIGYIYNYKKMMDFALGVSFQNNSFSSDEFKFGLEYNYKKMFYLRGSFTVYTDKSGSSEQLFGPSFGAGLHYPFGSVSLGLDYAYRVINESALNSTNQFFTLSLGF
ncbi:MAG: PorV/PorQ family protein [Ignavibacteriae bacterium]|jgi:hypothetical protein|nr:PorV/PorQ family protein [Ignavibacteriota bacterium]